MSDRFYWNGTHNVPSGTTVLPSPHLAQWAANCAADFVDKWSDDMGQIHDPQIIDLARKAYEQESREAADYGTYIHLLCELALTKGLDIESPHELTQGFMKQFRAWVNKHNVKPIAMEYEILMPKYGGRLDLVCEMDSFWMTKAWCKRFGVEWYKGIEKQRVITLVDFKTGKGSYYETWKYQLAGYRQGYNTNFSVARDDYVGQPVLKPGGMVYCPPEINDDGPIQHHGILKFNKESGKVNYKDFTVWETTRDVATEPRVDGELRKEKYIRTYEDDRKTFNTLVDLWWMQKRGYIL
jgi:hypothetical protein